MSPWFLPHVEHHLVFEEVGVAIDGGEVGAGARAVSDHLAVDAQVQGLTLVHSSAQLEPCLTEKNTLNTP